jgi:oligopeptide/dipeptide ABC transporter ATP-binding protein
MYGGQIVELGKGHEIYENPKHPYTQKLVSSIPSIKNKENGFQYMGEKSLDLSRNVIGYKFYDSCPYE